MAENKRFERVQDFTGRVPDISPNVTVTPVPVPDTSKVQILQTIDQIGKQVGTMHDEKLVKQSRDESGQIVTAAFDAAEKLGIDVQNLNKAAGDLEEQALTTFDVELLNKKRAEVQSLVRQVESGRLNEHAASLRLNLLEQDFIQKYPHLTNQFNNVRALGEHLVGVRYQGIGSLAARAMKSIEDNPVIKGINETIKNRVERVSSLMMNSGFTQEAAQRQVTKEDRLTRDKTELEFSKLHGEVNAGIVATDLGLVGGEFEAFAQPLALGGIKMEQEQYQLVLGSRFRADEQRIRAKYLDYRKQGVAVGEDTLRTALAGLREKYEFWNGFAESADIYNRTVKSADRINITNIAKLSDRYGAMFPVLPAILGQANSEQRASFMKVLQTVENNWTLRTNREEFLRMIGATLPEEEKAGVAIAEKLLEQIRTDQFPNLAMFLISTGQDTLAKPVDLSEGPASSDPLRSLGTNFAASVVSQPLANKETDAPVRKVQVDNVALLVREQSSQVFQPQIRAKIMDPKNTDVREATDRRVGQFEVAAMARLPSLSKFVDSYQIDGEAVKAYKGDKQPTFVMPSMQPFSATNEQRAVEQGVVQADLTKYMDKVNYFAGVYRMTHSPEETLAFINRLLPQRATKRTYQYNPSTNAIEVQ